MITPQGFFDGSKGAWLYVAYRNTGTLQVVNDEATLQRFYRPNLLGAVLTGKELSK